MIKDLIKNIIKLSGYELRKVHPDLTMVQENNLETPYKKVHYGSGYIPLRGWMNLDYIIYADNKNFPDEVKVDLTKRHPFADNSFNFGYSQDFLEHMMQADQLIFLEEVFRTLKLGGVLRLSFPSLSGSLKQYYTKKDYFGFVAGKYGAFTQHIHFHLPTFEELEEMCKFIGFTKIYKVNYGESTYSELCNLDTREEQMELNLLVEVIK